MPTIATPLRAALACALALPLFANAAAGAPSPKSAQCAVPMRAAIHDARSRLADLAADPIGARASRGASDAADSFSRLDWEGATAADARSAMDQGAKAEAAVSALDAQLAALSSKADAIAAQAAASNDPKKAQAAADALRAVAFGKSASQVLRGLAIASQAFGACAQ